MSTFQTQHEILKRSLSESDLAYPECGARLTNKSILDGLVRSRCRTRSLSDLSRQREASCTRPPLPPRHPRPVDDLPVEHARYERARDESKKGKTVKRTPLSAISIWGLRHRKNRAHGTTEGSELQSLMPTVFSEFVKDSVWRKRLGRLMKAHRVAHMMSGALPDGAVD